ncbi:MAG: hypothetical protein K2K19_10330, partial [Acetatifactor sp.]|nr:hypothetical protein [Acetatifactor sp.]
LYIPTKIGAGCTKIVFIENFFIILHKYSYPSAGMAKIKGIIPPSGEISKNKKNLYQKVFGVI